MFNRRLFLTAAAAGISIALPHPSHASEKQAYTEAAFRAALAGGRPILVDVAASWCPTCHAQHPILSELTAQPRFKDLVIFDIDFDTQKEALRALNVRMQSTLLVFKGGKEVGRSTGDTDRASIDALLSSAI